jgi:CAAX protease family protein
MNSPTNPPSRLREFIFLLIVFSVAIGIIVVALTLGRAGVTFFDRNASIIAAILFLYLPLLILRYEKGDPTDYGFSFGNVKEGLIANALAIAVLFPPFIFGFILWQTRVAGLELSPGVPDNLLNLILVQFIVVALPEEAFYRGYLQTKLERLFPGKVKIWKFEMSWAILAASFLFAIGHVITWRNPLRFNVFFPGLIFGMMRSATGSIAAGVLFHALCNLLVAFLLS